MDLLQNHSTITNISFHISFTDPVSNRKVFEVALERLKTMSHVKRVALHSLFVHGSRHDDDEEGIPFVVWEKLIAEITSIEGLFLNIPCSTIQATAIICMLALNSTRKSFRLNPRNE